MKNILNKFKELRLKKGYSHEYMGHELKISQVAYSKIERNETKLSIERFFKIAEILEVSIADILEIQPENQMYSADNLQKISTLYKENKENSERINKLYETIIKDKEHIIQQLKSTIESVSINTHTH